MKKRIELKFECQEDFESMPCTNKGRFCGACKREIIDFTKLSLEEVYRAKEANPELCGIFNAEQLEPHLHPIELPPVRKWAFLSTLLVSLNIGNVNGQTQKDRTPTEISFVERTDALGDDFDQNTMAEPAEVFEQSPWNNEKREIRKRNRQHRRYIRRRDSKWYWSLRFPFLHKKPNQVRHMGMPRWL